MQHDQKNKPLAFKEPPSMSSMRPKETKNAHDKRVPIDKSKIVKRSGRYKFGTTSEMIPLKAPKTIDMKEKLSRVD